MYNWRVVYYRFVTDHRGHNRTQTSHWVFLLAILFSWSDNRAPCAVGMEKWNFLMSLLHLLSTMLCKHYPTIYNTYNLHEHTITRSTLDNTYSTTPPPALPPIDLPDACLKLGVHWTTPAHLTLEVHWTTPTVQPPPHPTPQRSTRCMFKTRSTLDNTCTFDTRSTLDNTYSTTLS